MTVKVTGLAQVQAKLATAAPRIDALDLLMVSNMLAFIKSETAMQTPIGPGHFGFHARDGYKTETENKESGKVIGRLKGKVQAFWREFGTVHQRRFWVAHRAKRSARQLVKVYYGKALWWRA